jgi:hypothetical protein
MARKKAKKTVQKVKTKEVAKEMSDADLEGVSGGALLSVEWSLNQKLLEPTQNLDASQLGVWYLKK